MIITEWNPAQLTHARLLELLNWNMARYCLLKYAIHYVWEEIPEEQTEDAPVYPIIPAWDTFYDSFAISRNNVVERIAAFENGLSFKENKSQLMQFSAHLVRTGAINFAVEIIKAYCDKHSELKIMDTLKGELWYAAMYVVRNNASHADNHHKTLSFKKCDWIRKRHGASFVYDNIRISEGMLCHNIRYNDKQILCLLRTSFDYFKNMTELP